MERTDTGLLDILQNLLTLKKTTDIFENEVFELKEAKSEFSYDKLYQYFSALSNEANLLGIESAWLVLGISNDGSAVGSTFLSGKGDISECKRKVGNRTNNRISFIGIYEISFEEKRILMFEIPAAPKGVPTTVDGIAYGRDGASLVALSDEKRDRILRQPRYYDWSREIVPEASMRHLDPEAITAARSNYVMKNPRLASEVAEWSDERFLNTVPLTIDGKITRAALILLGKPESRYLLSPADAALCWFLEDKDGERLDNYIGTGPFILEIDEIYRRIRNLKYRYIPKGTLFPTEVDMYEEYLIREPLNNAIAHQDYSLGVRISVAELPDHLVFYNAGSFIPGSVENVLSNTQPEARYHNPFLVNAMRQLDLIDTAWSGIRTMFRLQSKKFFPMPEFEITDNAVKVTIYGKILNQDFAEILSRNGDLTLPEIVSLNRVSKGQSISSEMAEVLRRKNLIEGRRPNYYLSKSVAKSTNQRAKYTANRGFDKKYYQDLILAGIEEHGELSRKEIDELLFMKLPETYNTYEKKHAKINYLLSDLKQRGMICPTHRGHGSAWTSQKRPGT